MQILNELEIKKLDILNNKLKVIEEKIYKICLKQNQIALQKILQNQDNINAYELEVCYYFYDRNVENSGETKDEENLIAYWCDNIKPIMLKDNWCGIYDKKCHNTTSIFQKDTGLNCQSHCWLLHSLYDHILLSWNDIFSINYFYFDIKIQYEYSLNIANSRCRNEI